MSAYPIGVSGPCYRRDVRSEEAAAREPAPPPGAERRPREWSESAGQRLAAGVVRAVRRIIAETRTAFGRLVVVHGASNAGDALVVLALSGTLFFSVAASTARTKVGLYLLMTMAPYAVLSPIVGPLLDRRRGSRRLAIIIASAGRAVVCLWIASRTGSNWLYPGAFLLLVLSRAYGVARSAMVPALHDDAHSLVAANARLSMVAIASGAVVSAPGIVLLKVFSGGAVLRAAAVFYAAAALVALPLPKPETEPEEVRSEQAAFATPTLRNAARAAAAVRALGGFLLFLLAFALKREGVSSLGYGFVLACTGVGAAVASFVVPRLRSSGNEEFVILLSLAAGAAVPAVVFSAFGLPAAAVVAGTSGLVGAGVRLAFESLVQREAPAAAHGRAFARYETLFQLAWVSGAAIPVAAPVGASGGLVAAAAAFTATGVAFFLGRHRRGRL